MSSVTIKTFSGIGPDAKHAIDHGETAEKEQKLVREALISAYDKNIATRLKAELCSLDINNYGYSKDSSTSKFNILPFK